MSTSILSLGLIQNIENDAITFKIILKNLPGAKEEILGIAFFILDPLGILTPCLFEAKYIMQQLGKLYWEQAITNYLTNRWKLWKQEINHISTVSVSRWFGFHLSITNDIEFLIHCNTSQTAYRGMECLRQLEKNSET